MKASGASLDRHVGCAIAEDLHIRRRFAESTTQWMTLSHRFSENWALKLKVALGLFSLGRTVEGNLWLERAAAAGAPAVELNRVRSQVLRQQRRPLDVIELLKGPASSSCSILQVEHAIALASVGNFVLARRYLAKSLVARNASGYAYLNAAVAGPIDRRWEMLESAAELAPAAPEPHELLAFWDLCGDRESRRLAEARARIRLGQHPVLEYAEPAERNTRSEYSGRVSVAFHEGAIRFRITAKMNGVGKDDLFIRVHRDCESLEIALNVGESNWQRVACRGTSLSWRVARIKRALFREGKASLYIRGSLTPKGRGVHLSSSRVELAGAVFAVPSPNGHFTYRVEHVGLAATVGIELFKDGDRPPIIDCLGVAGPPVLHSRHLLVYAEVGVSRYSLELLNQAVSRSMQVWRTLCARAVSKFKVVITNTPKSTFCYAREGVLRVSSGVLIDECISQVHHEFGHLVNGSNTRFAGSAEWFSEGLAELTNHLIENAGGLLEYRRQIDRDSKGRAFQLSLSDLAAERSLEAAQAFREKAGYIVYMLYRIIGTSKFRHMQRLLARRRSGRMESDEVIALASWAYGSSLRWFFEQWLCYEGTCSATCTASASCEGEGWHLKCRVRLTSIQTPGRNVTIAIRLANGSTIEHLQSLELGGADFAMSLASQPQSLVVDPRFEILGLNVTANVRLDARTGVDHEVRQEASYAT